MGAIAPFAFGRLWREEGGRGGRCFFPVFFCPTKTSTFFPTKKQRRNGGEERKIILGRDFVVCFFHGEYGLLFF